MLSRPFSTKKGEQTKKAVWAWKEFSLFFKNLITLIAKWL